MVFRKVTNRLSGLLERLSLATVFCYRLLAAFAGKSY
jgi:hypothetical protein